MGERAEQCNILSGDFELCGSPTPDVNDPTQGTVPVIIYIVMACAAHVGKLDRRGGDALGPSLCQLFLKRFLLWYASCFYHDCWTRLSKLKEN